MRYVRAQDVLPPDLLDQLQLYVDGAYLYVPRKGENRLSWGARTHSKEETRARNQEIFLRAQAGEPPARLAEVYFLTEKTIRRILSQEKKRLSL